MYRVFGSSVHGFDLLIKDSGLRIRGAGRGERNGLGFRGLPFQGSGFRAQGSGGDTGTGESHSSSSLDIANSHIVTELDMYK